MVVLLERRGVGKKEEPMKRSHSMTTLSTGTRAKMMQDWADFLEETLQTGRVFLPHP